MPPIRILQIVPNMQAGGLESFIMNIYRNIPRDVIQFDFLVHYNKRCFYDDEIEALGGKIYRFALRENYNFFNYLSDIKLFFRTHREYRVIHGHMPSLGALYFRQAYRNGIPTRICHSHNTAAERTLKGLAVHVAGRFAIYRANELLSCSAEAGRYLFGRRRFDVVPNAVDTERFKPDPAVRASMREQLRLSGRFVIGHVGRFELQKNHQFLIHIFSEIKRQNPDSSLLLVGAGAQEPIIRNLVTRLGLKDSVFFLGVRSDVEDLYQAMDAFVLPSFFEGLPLVLIEAQYAGLPVFVSDVVSGEAGISDRYYPISLRENAAYWAKRILALSGVRDCISAEITNTQYDIRNLADKMTAFYCGKHKGMR